ncbi:MAG: hypothetical protein KA157_05465 [Aliarcobacter sp.]|jgi:hypothetical protein|nr:hypothetical protein [Aliarcobacter sp.]
MSSELFFNNTFTSGPNGASNACVGNNGWQELESYGDGYDEAVKIMYEAIKSDTGLLDIVIHPMVFSSRHRIELFLKASIKAISKIRENLTVSDDKLIKTHDLNNLWDIYESLATDCDSRLKPHIEKQKEIVLEFAEVDPTGETFRYPYSQSNQKHLIQTPVINVETFYKRYSELSADMIEMTFLLESLENEYKQNTFTSKLSRFEIACIAEELPLREEWGNDSFTAIKDMIKDKYNLSSRNFSEVLNIIQRHREFSLEIGVEIPIEHLNLEKMGKAIVLIDEVVQEQIGFNINNPKFTNEKLNNANHIFNNEFTKSEITCLYTMIEHGLSRYYSEGYDLLYNIFEVQEDKESMIIELYKKNAIARIKESLEKLGQRTLLELFN